MELALCTISFRHHLVSLAELALWARNHGFSGIELWGAHARHLADQPQYNADWLATFGLRVPMISDYLPTEGPAAEWRRQTQALCHLARRWGAPRIRTFAGRKGSMETPGGTCRRGGGPARAVPDCRRSRPAAAGGNPSGHPGGQWRLDSAAAG
ncbi:hypothetical protein MBH78_08670 [Oceanimonas sp. NS1]|nr:hypothetical protein [Oceanimonas sp. NS1]